MEKFRAAAIGAVKDTVTVSVLGGALLVGLNFLKNVIPAAVLGIAMPGLIWGGIIGGTIGLVQVFASLGK